MKYPNKLKYRSALALMLCSSLFLSNCAMICSSKWQKITFQSKTPDATVEFDGKKVGKGQKVKINKYKYYYTANVEKKGYKSMNYAFELNKRSPTYAFTALNLLIPFYGWFYGFPFDAASPKTRKTNSVQEIPALVSLDSRKADEKYMLINNTAFDAKGSDLLWHDYRTIVALKAGKHKDSRSIRKHNKSKDRDDIKVDNTIFTSALNGTLKEMGFIDTTKSIFPNINNSLYLNATATKITVHRVESRMGKYMKNKSTSVKYSPNSMISVELEISWEVLDYYKQSLHTTKTVKKSDLFIVSAVDEQKAFHDALLDAIKDNMDYSVLDVRKQLTDKGLLSVTNNKVNEIPAITIAKPAADPAKRMNDFMRSSVTVKVDDGHGSGIIVSEDGYIITAYHVVVGSKKIEVIINDSVTVTAEVVRKNTEADLALLKVNKTGLEPLAMSQETDPEIGVDVWVIGTPKSIELGKSVSKGILSGLRKANGVNYLQTDVSVNHGNSGGALISKDGRILGIVTAKLEGAGVEGIGFAISAQEIFNRLKVQY